jgi:hypothetical protein
MGLGNGNGGGDNKLMERINYMIHMMEEQQYEKTNNITEEFILYVLLVYLRYLSWIRLAILESTRAIGIGNADTWVAPICIYTGIRHFTFFHV